MVTLREEHAQQTRDALIAAGTERFATDGYASTSVARIVEDARVSKGAFYHHFPDKKALLKAVVSAACERSEVMIRQTVEGASGSGDLVASALDAAMEAVQNDEEGKLFLAALKEAHRALGDKLLPQAYYYGFIPRDVEYFEEEV